MDRYRVVVFPVVNGATGSDRIDDGWPDVRLRLLDSRTFESGLQLLEFEPTPDFATSAACWLAAGAAHHTVTSTAVGVEVFRDFAEMAQTELLVIDEHTTVRDFHRELRWNHAYHRLARGL